MEKPYYRRDVVYYENAAALIQLAKECGMDACGPEIGGARSDKFKNKYHINLHVDPRHILVK